MAGKFIGAQKRVVTPGGFVPSRRLKRTPLRSKQVRDAADRFLSDRGIVQAPYSFLTRPEL